MANNTAYIQRAVKNRLRNYGYQPFEDCDAQVMEVIEKHLCTGQYMTVVSILVEKNEDCLRKFQRCEAKTVISTFCKFYKTRILLEPSHIQLLGANNIINTECSKERTLKHLTSIKGMMALLKMKTMFRVSTRKPPFRVSCISLHHIILQFRVIKGLQTPLIQLMSLAYWLVLYCDKMKKDNKKGTNYDSKLHCYLSDFVVTFILLLSRIFRVNRPTNNTFDLPGIVETIFVMEGFPKNPLFLEEILKEMCEILKINPTSHTENRVKMLALNVCKYFTTKKKEWLLATQESPDKGICTIICDQAQYMVPYSDNLEGNPTIKHTMQNVNKGIHYLSNISPNGIESIFTMGHPKIIKTSLELMSHNMPNEKCAPTKLNVTDGDNTFHHILLIGLIWHCTNDIPTLRKNGWIDVDNFIHYCRKMARKVVMINPTDKNKYYDNIAKTIVTLEEIIYSRCRASQVVYKGGISINKEHKKHKEVIIFFVAFRACLMCIQESKTHPDKNQQKLTEEYVKQVIMNYNFTAYFTREDMQNVLNIMQNTHANL